jgi:predicted nucleic acid-binding Zn ribbon protein
MNNDFRNKPKEFICLKLIVDFVNTESITDSIYYFRKGLRDNLKFNIFVGPRKKPTETYHNEIIGEKNKLNKLLNMVSNSDEFVNSKIYKSYLSIYKRIEKNNPILDYLNEQCIELDPFIMDVIGNDTKFSIIRKNTEFVEMIAFCVYTFCGSKPIYNRLCVCPICSKYSLGEKNTKQYCSNKCRYIFNSRKKTKSGENREYKRKRKEEGKAPPSYYG